MNAPTAKGCHRKRRGEKKSREGEENWIQQVRLVGAESKERKSGIERTKATCKERKLNITRPRIYDRFINEIELTMRWQNKERNEYYTSWKKNKEKENLNEMNKNTWKILRKNTPREGWYLRDGSGGNYFTTDDKNPKRARGESCKKKCELKEEERFPERTAKWRKRKWKWSGHGGQRGIKKTTKEGA